MVDNILEALVGYNALVRLRTFVHKYIFSRTVRLYYNVVWGTRIGAGSRISLSAKLDKTFPEGIKIGEYTAVSFGTTILTHDFVNDVHRPVEIGSFCFIGARALIMPGVTIGDHCIIGAATLVMQNVPPGSVVMGNPGRIIERGIETGQWGRRTRSTISAPDAYIPQKVNRL